MAAPVCIWMPVARRHSSRTLGIVHTMKRGIEILIMWLVLTVVVFVFNPFFTLPRNGMSFSDFLAILSFLIGSWIYGHHSGRLSPVICYGLIAGAFCAVGPLSLLHGPWRQILPLTNSRLVGIVAVPFLMAWLCSWFCILRRYFDGVDDTDA
jgi:hypothetical protein